MDEYIKKSDAIMAIQPNFIRGGSIEETVLRVAQSKINELPPADVAPVVHGEWAYMEEWGRLVTNRCSRCGQTLTTKQEEKMNYCPNCGAKMDGHTTPAKRMEARLKARCNHDR